MSYPPPPLSNPNRPRPTYSATGTARFRSAWVELCTKRITEVVAALLCAAMTACGEFPKDAEDTLRQVEAGRPLRVGWSAAGPWVRDAGGTEPAGIEPELIRRWAADRGVRVEWIEGGEAQLVEGLSENSLDVAVAGFTKRAPWGGKIGQTQPYLKAKIVIGARPGVRVPDDWKGVRVAYDPARPEFAALLRKEKAVPTTGEAPFRAVYEAELAPAGLLLSGTTLRTEQRTIATAPSENALTLSLDRFLHANKATIEQRLEREARP
jgi:polar amino acid transport system substrate-binding protein